MFTGSGVLPGNLISPAPHSILQGPSPLPSYKDKSTHMHKIVNPTSAWNRFPPDGRHKVEQGVKAQK